MPAPLIRAAETLQLWLFKLCAGAVLLLLAVSAPRLIITRAFVFQKYTYCKRVIIDRAIIDRGITKKPSLTNRSWPDLLFL